MDVFKIIDKWDNILFHGYNFVAAAQYGLKYKQIHSIVGRNKQFKNKHKGERCFIVLNGPSLLRNDISVLKNEHVFCANYMYKSDIVDTIDPEYYCWMDSLIFMTPDEGRETIKEVQQKCPEGDLFLNFKAYDVVDRNEHTFFTYNKHMPSTDGFSYAIDGLSSGYTNVLGYVVGIAIYMGFSEINILGLDFEPAGFSHFEQDVDGTERQDARNHETLTHYGSTLKAHSEFIGLSKYAKKHNITIRNLNPDSYVTAFEFSTLDKVINK